MSLATLSLFRPLSRIVSTSVMVMTPASSRLIHPATRQLLAPVTQVQTAVPAATLKYVARPKKRCPSCYLEVIDERLFNFCTKHPRHKQAQIIKRPRFGMILTHATQGGDSKKQGRGRREMATQNNFRLDF